MWASARFGFRARAVSYTHLDVYKRQIWDDVAHSLQTGSAFDGEGMRRLRVPLVENGVVTRIVYARATAERMKRSEHKDTAGPIEPTGHGFPLPNEMGEMPLNIVFAAPQDPQTLSETVSYTHLDVYKRQGL